MKKQLKDTLRSSLKFVLWILPLAVIAGISISFYEMGTGIIPKEALEQMTTGQIATLITIQTMIWSVVCGFLGHILAEKTGLLRPFNLNKEKTVKTVILGALCGIIFFALDYFIFSNILVPVADYYQAYSFSLSYIGSKLFYGGVVEELIMRWFLMSLLVFILWKIFARKAEKTSIPIWIFVLSNIVVAVLFAMGHLPATVTMFGYLDFVIIMRCMVLNGVFGMVFGELYRKYGIQYAMIAHAMTHVACELLFFLVLRVL